ncbi:MAG TPA: hypothetical protein PK299_03340 [Anaerolineales bacterium]|nr:hypothetical protein [Anaerolineales bacterium]
MERFNKYWQRYFHWFLGGFGVIWLGWSVFVRGVPTQIDGLNHFYRLLELHWAVQNGQFYPRWSPDLVYGFGAPLFNFYPPLSYWVAEIPLLLGVPAPVAMQLGYLSAIATLLVGSYLLGKRVSGSQWGGCIVAIGYGFAPYTYFNLVERAAYPELWGMACVTWATLGILQLVQAETMRTRLKALLLTVLACTALVYAHSLSSFMYLPILLTTAVVGLFAGKVYSTRRGTSWQVLLAGSVAFAWVLLLTLAWWLPVLYESHLVQLQRTLDAPFADFRQNFVNGYEFFAPPPAYDPLLMAQHRAISVFTPMLLLAGLGLWNWRKHRHHPLFPLVWGLLALGYAFLQFPQSLPLWEAFPTLAYLQFPWRLLGPLGLLLALLSASGFQALPTRWQNIVGVGVVLLGLGYSLSRSYAPTQIPLAGITHRDIPTHEQATGWIATTTSSEFLPIWAETRPDALALADAYQNNQLPARRLDRTQLPVGVNIVSEIAGYQSLVIEYDSNTAWTAYLNWLVFADMQVELDGQSFALQIQPASGLAIIADLPAGRHLLRVERRDSAVQSWGSGVSFLPVWLA